jgi:glycerol-3-phosphate dehydrogenase (NAD(P)+)
MKVGVIGLGNWGTALAQHCAALGYDVVGLSNNSAVVAEINTAHRNPLCLSGIGLHPGLRATDRLDQLLDADVLIFAIPAKALRSFLQQLKVKDGAILVSAIKGLEPETLTTPVQCLKAAFGLNPVAVLSGPSFAKDLVRGLPLGLVAACDDVKVAEHLAQSFSNPYMKVYTSTDTIGVELGGIAKNVIAIAAGVTDALGLGDSARAGLITRGLAEITRLAVALGANARTLSGLSGLGDLVLTATCDSSRNRVVGLRLGKGEQLDDILRNLGSVSEGVFSAPIMLQIAKSQQVEMPISEEVANLIAGRISPEETVKRLMSRPVKSELA